LFGFLSPAILIDSYWSLSLASRLLDLILDLKMGSVCYCETFVNIYYIVHSVTTTKPHASYPVSRIFLGEVSLPSSHEAPLVLTLSQRNPAYTRTLSVPFGLAPTSCGSKPHVNLSEPFLHWHIFRCRSSGAVSGCFRSEETRRRRLVQCVNTTRTSEQYVCGHWKRLAVDISSIAERVLSGGLLCYSCETA
jgi:hypothetical protein